MIEARQRFRRALELAPENVEALIGLAGSVLPYREKREHLLRALELDSSNAEARASLAYVETKIAAGELLAPRGAASTPQVQSIDTLKPEPSVPAVDVQYCYIHPNRETGLLCTQCQRPICAQCMVRAPVGQLCPECAKARRPTNYKVSFGILALLAPGVLITSLALSYLVLRLLAPIPFISFILAFVLAPIVGEGLVRVLDRLTKAKRGKKIQLTVGISLGLGAAPWLLLVLPSFSGLLLLLFIAIVIVTAMTRLR